METMKTNPAALTAALRGDYANAAVASVPGGIERQERGGQEALVRSTLMPKEMRPDRRAFEAVGFVFGEDADELFLKATLPTGWRREASDHAMHSSILDDKGRQRVSVFYKAAFYDGRADAGLVCRYRASYTSGDDSTTAAVYDGETIIFETEAVEKYDLPAEKALLAKAVAWLAERYPDAANPLYGWDA